MNVATITSAVAFQDPSFGNLKLEFFLFFGGRSHHFWIRELGLAKVTSPE